MILNSIMIKLVQLLFCHLIGDYVLSSDYIETTKGKNWYHLFVHTTLYCVPFAYVFGINYKLLIVFLSHIIIKLVKLLLCHMMGDYVFQSDFIASTKGKIGIIYLFIQHYIVYHLHMYLE